MSDELEAFQDVAPGQDQPNTQLQRVVRELLVFEYSGDAYAVLASCVAGVVPWKAPARVPGADRKVAGVIQDRGRIVVLMAHPTGRQCESLTDAKRVVVCVTNRGYIGLPASVTRSVGPVELDAEPGAFSVHDSARGPFTYLDPTAYAVTQ
jgi:chemotaxis signal transduction protein